MLVKLHVCIVVELGSPHNPNALPASVGPSPLHVMASTNNMLTAKSVVLVMKGLPAVSGKSKLVGAGLLMERNEQKSFLHFRRVPVAMPTVGVSI